MMLRLLAILPASLMLCLAPASAENRIALVIPCHRVIGGDGGLAGYRWGVARKRRVLADEAAARG